MTMMPSTVVFEDRVEALEARRRFSHGGAVRRLGQEHALIEPRDHHAGAGKDRERQLVGDVAEPPSPAGGSRK